MPSRQEVQRGHEIAILDLFAKFYSQLKGSTFRVVERPDPPDGVLRSQQAGGERKGDRLVCEVGVIALIEEFRALPSNFSVVSDDS